MKGCNRPPRGWYCLLERNHDGPCPAWAHWWNIKWWLKIGPRRWFR